MKLHHPTGNQPPFPVYSIETDALSELTQTKYPSENFVMLLAANFADNTTDEISTVAMKLISRGLKYILCWGNECKKAHDAFDFGNILLEEKEATEHHLMSTWHNGESFEEVLWFCLYNALPDDEYWATTSIILASVGKTVSETQFKYLDDIKKLNSVVGV